MKKYKLLICGIAALGILGCLFIYFCVEKEDDTRQKIQVAVSFCDTKNARTTAIWQDVLANLGQYNFSVEWRDAQADIEKQKADIRELLEYKPEYLIVKMCIRDRSYPSVCRIWI